MLNLSASLECTSCALHFDNSRRFSNSLTLITKLFDYGIYGNVSILSNSSVLKHEKEMSFKTFVSWQYITLVYFLIFLRVFHLWHYMYIWKMKDNLISAVFIERKLFSLLTKFWRIIRRSRNANSMQCILAAVFMNKYDPPKWLFKVFAKCSQRIIWLILKLKLFTFFLENCFKNDHSSGKQTDLGHLLKVSR